MINKIFKIINNKFSRIFKFIFFLRYLFLIFFVATVLFISIPHFFDYKKREKIIINNLSQNYGFKIKALANIKFNSFPTPNFEINEVSANFVLNHNNFQTEKLIIYPKLSSIYNYQNFHIKKIKLENNIYQTDLLNLKDFSAKILHLEKKLSLNNLNLKIIDNNNNVINLKKVNFLNYGYNKNIIYGEVFSRKFKINLKDDLENIYFKLQNTGVSASLNILDNEQSNEFKGSFKGKVLKSNFKFDFDYDDEVLKIKKFFFRDKQISFNSEGLIKIKPFFKVYSSTEIKNIDKNLLKNIDLEKLLKFKDIIKRVSSKNDFTFQSKRFSGNIIKDLLVKTNLEYGRLNINKNFSFSNSEFACISDINLLEEYPVLNFNCLVNSPNKKELFKKLNINYKGNRESFNLNVKGNINILNNKINFDDIKANSNYKASKEDLEFYKVNFENILFNKNFINIFELSKIKNFISEIS